MLFRPFSGEKLKKKDIRNLPYSKTNRLLFEAAYKAGFNIIRSEGQGRLGVYKGRKLVLSVNNGKFIKSANHKLSVKLTDNKVVCNSFLRSLGVTVPRSTEFWATENETAWLWAKDRLPVVVKPLKGTKGKHVFVNINSEDEFNECFSVVAKDSEYIMVEEHVSGDEYRFCYVDGVIVAVAKRIPANVVGDGFSTVYDLIKKKNKGRKKSGNPIHKKIPLNDETKRVLARSGKNFDFVPGADEIVFLRLNSNVSTGGDAVDVTDDIEPYVKEYVANGIRNFDGLIGCGVDVLIEGSQVTILEINASPMFSMHEFPWVGKRRKVCEKFIRALV